MPINVGVPEVRTTGTADSRPLRAPSSEPASFSTDEARRAVLKSLYNRRDLLVDLEPTSLVELELSEVDAAIDHWEAIEARGQESRNGDRLSEYRELTERLVAIQVRLERGY